ncbi:MAG: hypothetical protein BWY21_00571 [Parcubacteria group bacterium ADurb.Bin216]|nr:MAG: hypothetical protein BWY21_00571 [Parcubacteria group bacterium ADurb.Bin216]
MSSVISKEKTSNLYKGIFNYHGEVSTLYTTAESEGQAYRFFCERLAQRYDTASINIRHYFWGTDKYEIKIERSKEDGTKTC